MTLAIEHLKLRLRPINRALRAAVDRQSAMAARLRRPDVVPLCVTDDQVLTLLDDCDALLSDEIFGVNAAKLNAEEKARQEELRGLNSDSGKPLPIDRLVEALSLSDFELEAILLCFAPDLDRSYERVFAYILDDLNRRYPCRELICSLSASTLNDRLQRRREINRFGRLLRTGVLRPFGDAPTEWRQEFRTAPGLFDFLCGFTGDLTSFYHDPAEITPPTLGDLPPQVDLEMIERAGSAFKTGELEVFGIWGTRNSYQAEMAWATATASGLKVRRWIPPRTTDNERSGEADLLQAIEQATALEALLWVETDRLNKHENEDLSLTAAVMLACSGVPLILTGTDPWRPTELLERRAYAEIELDEPTFDSRRTMWEQALPEVGGARLGDVASRFRVGAAQVRAAARVAKTQAHIHTNGHVATISDQLDNACAAVTRKNTNRYGSIVKPKRGPEDLILPDSLHRRVMEVAQFFRILPQVTEEWGFGRMMTGGGGIKALMTGDAGVGKTLAAEVIAGVLSMPLLKVSLSSVVSKWVGETEQNLDAAFREAEDNNAVLFFDEAEALFGKRGEVQHGTDRYANLEVSFLLQRFEEFAGICLCSSNLKESVDSAFTRRFQIVLHFPRPEISERLRLWNIAFPPHAPLEPSIDFEVLARLDMTGANIVGAAETAALMAAHEGAPIIKAGHVIEAIARQYRRDARLLTASDLGPYAHLLEHAR